MSTLIGAGITDQDKAHFAVFEVFAERLFSLMRSHGITCISSHDGVAVLDPGDQIVRGFKVEFADDEKEDA